jgi:transposase-like protein
MIERTHVAIWKWVQKYSSLAERFRIDRRSVKRIFVDETLLRIDGQDYWLWIAYEPDYNACLAMHLSGEGQFLYATSSSDSCKTDMAKRQYSQTVLIGTICPASGSG